MARSPGRWLLDAVSFIFAATPIGFALIRAITTGHDWRYLWVALAALLGAAVVMVVGRPYRRRPMANVSVSFVALLFSTVLAMLAALSIGTRLTTRFARSRAKSTGSSICEMMTAPLRPPPIIR